MSLETIVLITVLTFLSIYLGADFLWKVTIEPALSNLEIIATIEQQTIYLLLIVVSLVFVGAIVLNVIPNSRSEPYLLRIGLASLIAVLFLIFTEFTLLNNAIALEFLTSSNLLDWIRLVVAIVAYWSFLHYALNPKN
ncbi:MAG: hypothetical protein HC847_18135 [Hydrococcus sp. RU_2_2]|nr:hypothetical protein [Hydrococcus sp. RU_2_2]